MAEVKALIKLQIPGGTATAGPPVGSALGAHGVQIGDFVNQFNEQTSDRRGKILPVIITVFDDRSFSFVVKQPPMGVLIKEKLGLKSGSGEPNKTKVGHLTVPQMREIAEEKMPDLNARTPEAAMKIVAGQARSMGITADAIPDAT